MPVPEELEALLQQARGHIQRRELPEAVALYSQILAGNDRESRAQEGLAMCAFLAGDLDLAETHYKRLTLIDSRKADAFINLGAVYNRKQDFKAAVRTLQQAIAKSRKSAEAYYNLGIAYKGLNQTAMAVSAYKEAIRLTPTMVEAYQNLGNLYVDMGNFQQAILNFNRALELRPDFEKVARSLAFARQQAGKQEQQASPFGRLVNVAELPQRSAAQVTLRPQTFAEQLADRAAVLGLATAFEQAGQKLLSGLREQLSPALLGLSHAFAQNDPSQLHSAYDSLDAALSQYRTAASALLQCGDKLQEHEEALRQRLRS